MECFDKALPIWPVGREREMNLTIGFRAIISVQYETDVIIRIAASTIYRVSVNGLFVGHGPARGPHGFYRVDEWKLNRFLTEKQNVVAVEVNGANVNSYYTLDQPSFLQAEIRSGNVVIASTHDSEGEFEAVVLQHRVQNIQRYSYQRTFAEYYCMDSKAQDWMLDPYANVRNEVCQAVEPKVLIGRGVPYPEFHVKHPNRVLQTGEIIPFKPDIFLRPGHLEEIGSDVRGYKLKELELVLSDQIQEFRAVNSQAVNEAYGLTMTNYEPCTFRTYDWGMNRTGFIRLKIRCKTEAMVYALFDELLGDDQSIDPLRGQCVNVIGFELQPGEYDLETMEPYTFRYLKLMVTEGGCEVDEIGLRELSNPATRKASFRSSNDALTTIFEAARETFSQNATDIYMDCPSRERAGWLCDSYFTARVEPWLTGASQVETNFIENFLLPDSFEGIPSGMLPMCYPADLDWQPFGNIPNWGFWFVLEAEEYLQRTHHFDGKDRLRNRIYDYLAYFEPFENEYGLLERLEGWVFVEWSKANELVQDVNYPINMLYAGALAAAGRMFGNDKLLRKADRIISVIRKQSFNGTFFADHAIRVDGALQVCEEMTESCQYYAFYFGIATQESHNALWSILLNEFGPERDASVTYPDVHPANAFIGNYLRLDLLSRAGEAARLMQEIESYFLYMAERTGTLWEHKDTSASTNHGFASHVVHWLYKDALGIQSVDHAQRLITVRPKRCGLESCEGIIPLLDGGIARLAWRMVGDSMILQADAELNYTIEVLEPVNLNIIRE
jgi:alpha-L-rhamnosidase